MPLTITTPTSFSLPAVVRSHGWIQMSPFGETSDHGLSYIIRLASGKVLLFDVHAIGPDLRGTTELLTPDEQDDLRSTRPGCSARP
jgi:hypothetical protein